MLENNPPNGAGLNPVSDESWSDPWHDLNLLDDILRLAGVKQLELGRIRLKAAFESWYRLIFAGAGAKEWSDIIEKGQGLYRALEKWEQARGENAEGDPDFLDYVDDVIRDQSKKQRSRLNSLTHGLRAVNALIEAFKIIKTENWLPHGRGQRRSRFHYACELVGRLEAAVLTLNGHFTLDPIGQTGTILKAMDKLRNADPDSADLLPPPDKHPVHTYKRWLQAMRDLNDERGPPDWCK